MNKLYCFRTVFILVLSTALSVKLIAQNFTLIDVNKKKGSYPSYPSNNEYSPMNMFAELNGIFYFSADDGTHGYELWSTDGAAAGTQLVKDVNPGPGSSYPFNIITSGNKLCFIATDNSNFPQIWISDGTEAGTSVLTDFTSYPNLSYLTDVNGTVYFINQYQDSNYNSHNELWKSDGTKEGTVLVADLFTADFGYGYNARYLVNGNGKLFFSLSGYYSDPMLYTSDGTAEGTVMVGDSYLYSYPSHLTSLNGLLYFSAFEGYFGNPRLWVTDGTREGTHTVNNIYDIQVPTDYFDRGYNSPFAVRGDVLFFQGGTYTSGFELCRYKTSDINKTIEIVKDIYPGDYNNSNPSFITNVKGTIFFTAMTNSGDEQLWKSDGTTAGTALVKNVYPGGGAGNYYGLINVKGTLMFAGDDGVSGFELWKSDGSDAGTVMVKDINPGTNNAYPGYFTFKDGQFLFSADNGSKGFELWRSDGTEGGTVLIKDINQNVLSSSDPAGFTSVGNDKTVFIATTDKTGREPWTTDETQEGTKLLQDINPGTDESYMSFFVKFKNKAYFTAYNGSGNFLGVTNGTKGGTSLFYQVPSNSYVTTLAATDNLLYFFLMNYNTYQLELWRSDGTQAGTLAIRTDLSPYYEIYPVAVGNILFFTNYDPDHGNELWKTDGTDAGTGLLKDINPGPYDSYPYNLYSFHSKLYFTVNTGYGNFLWTSDGTDAGTYTVKAINVVSSFAQTKDKLFFEAFFTTAKGIELYATDGSAAGTQLVKDINRGPASSINQYSYYYSWLVGGDSLIYLAADDGKHGSELWRSNGTKEGTYLVKNITSGSNGTNFYEMMTINDKAFFSINDTLWQSDGTKEGTHKVKDKNLAGVRNIHNLTAVRDNLYFSAYSPVAGQELFIGDLSNLFAPSQPISSNVSALKANNDFDARLLTNPVRDELKFIVTAKGRQRAQIIVTDAMGRTITSSKEILPPGVNMFSYPAQGWASGMYIIKIINEQGSSLLMKAVK